jgi:hypothetical protein
MKGRLRDLFAHIFEYPDLLNGYSPQERRISQRCLCRSKLVAEACADGDLVTALSAATAEDGSTGLGLHASQETVGLGAVAAVGLKGTLRHDKKLLRRGEHLLKLLGCCNNL